MKRKRFSRSEGGAGKPRYSPHSATDLMVATALKMFLSYREPILSNSLSSNSPCYLKSETFAASLRDLICFFSRSPSFSMLIIPHHLHSAVATAAVS